MDDYDLIISYDGEQPPGDDAASRFGDERLSQRARRDNGNWQEVFTVTEETDTLSIRCKLCERTVFGLRNLGSHIAGKKHQGKFSHEVSQQSVQCSGVEIDRC